MYDLPKQDLSDEFLAMWTAAGRHLSVQTQDAPLAWLKSRPERPFLEHLSFRLGNQLFFVRLEDVDGAVHGPASVDGLLTIARECGGYPCLLRMRHGVDGWHAVGHGWALLDARTEDPVDPVALVSDELIEMTDWELHDFAVQVVRQHLEGAGSRVYSSQGDPHVDPAIWFQRKEEICAVIVRASRAPLGDVPTLENWRERETFLSRNGQRVYYAPVGVIGADDAESGQAGETPLWRGHPMSVVFEGLVRIVDVDHDSAERSGRIADVTEPSRVQILFWPTQDDDEMAEICRTALDVSRERARELGQTALAAIRDGAYRTSQGRVVDWRDAIDATVRSKVSVPPEAELPPLVRPRFDEMRVIVANDTTLAAARRLVDLGYRPLVLNFANGKEPGGGFLSGARAQEEVLCRSSALVATLGGDPMYAAHARRSRPDSTAWAILSPDVPVFRTDVGDSLDEPWLLSVITCAAPYAPALGQPEAGDLLQVRIHRVLAVAQAYGYDALVLGAWGCGAFGNDPQRAARDFIAALSGEFAGAFREVVFAVADWSSERRFLGPFRDAADGRAG